MQTSQATGAAASQVGPEALSLAARLHYELGLSICKTAAVLHEVCGISITRGGVAQALAPSYLALVKSVRNSLTVAMDETGWQVLGVRAWLWVATAGLVMAFAIRPGRGFEEAAELIGKDCAGRLVRDGWAAYRKFEKAVHHTCAAHLPRRCDEPLETARGRGREIPRTVKAILLCALDLRDRRDADEIVEQEFQAGLATLKERHWRNWYARSEAPTRRKAGCSAIFIVSPTPSSPSCASPDCQPPTGWRNRRSDQQWSTGRYGAATGLGPELVIRSGY